MKGYVSTALMAVFCLVASYKASAASGTSEMKLDTPEKKYGVYLGIGNPYPTLLGINGAYNITKDIRASVGYGQIDMTSSITVSGNSVTSTTVTARTFGLGADYLWLNGSFRPATGLHVGYLNVSGEGDISFNSMKKNSAFLYANAGFDWLTESGFDLGAGLNLNVAGGSGAGFYINSGYFF